MNFELIDIHSHINFNAFRDDGPEVIRRAHDGGVGMILVGSQYETSRRAIEYADRYKTGVWAAVGLHPIHLEPMRIDEDEIAIQNVPGFKTRVEKFDCEKYKKFAEHPKTVAIGECGLDFFRTGETTKRKKIQYDTLRRQIALARDVHKPLIIHCRDAYEDLIKILREENAGEVGGTIHFFVGTWAHAKEFLDAGFHLSFTGVITFARDYDEVLKKAPLDRIMVETDAPYVAPVPHRGKRNEPLYVRDIARKLAEVRNIPYEEVSKATTENAARLFHLS